MGRLVLGLLSAMALKRLEDALEHKHDVITVDPVLFLIYLRRNYLLDFDQLNEHDEYRLARRT